MNKRQQVFARRVLVDGAMVSPTGPHGSPSTYGNHGCRCAPCTAAWRSTVASLRQQRYAKTAVNGGVAPIAAHGSTSTRMNWGCRCGPCQEAWAAAEPTMRRAHQKKQSERGKAGRRQARAGRICQQCSEPIDSVRTARAIYCAPCSTARATSHVTSWRLNNSGIAPGPPINSPFRVLVRSCLKCGALLTTPPDRILRVSGELPKCRTCLRKKQARQRRRRRQQQPRQARLPQIPQYDYYPRSAEAREWASRNGYAVKGRGPVPRDVRAKFEAANDLHD